MNSAEAEAAGVTNGDIVSVEIPSEGRKLTFGDVVIRVADGFVKAMHIDTDEANAAAMTPNATGTILK